MSIDLEFSKYAYNYDKYAIIQSKVTDELLLHVKGEPKKILDLGCGSGAVAKKISWDYQYLLGVDFAKNMLQIHPKSNKIECIYGNFEDDELYNHLYMYNFDYIISSSALQWAKDLDKVFANIKKLNTPFAFAIFTSNTFKTIHKTANISSPLRDSKEVLKIASKYFTCKSHINSYTLEFEKNIDMFRYIKKSGVSASRSILSYKQTKELIEKYPLNYLEFEVIFIYS